MTRDRAHPLVAVALLLFVLAVLCLACAPKRPGCRAQLVELGCDETGCYRVLEVKPPGCDLTHTVLTMPPSETAAEGGGR